MVNFKRMLEEHLASLSPEERVARETFKEIQTTHTYYETETMLDDNGVERKQEVCLYTRVWREGNGIKVGDKIILSFGGYREYQFCKDFIRRVGRKCQSGEGLGLCIDAGANVFVKPQEIMRIFEECIGALLERNIIIVEKY